MPASDSTSRAERPLGEHLPVMLREVVEVLARPGGTYVDATLGGGGHAAALLEAGGPTSRLLGVDADADALGVAAARLAPFGGRAVLVHANFRDLGPTAAAHGFSNVDGVVIDLGLSSRQLDVSGRGFSFRGDEPLDMRFDTTTGETAADILNGAAKSELADLIYAYGEEHRSRRVARAIVWRRQQAPLRTTGDLVAAVESALGPRRGRAHPATRTFQALRIRTNGELAALDAVLPQAAELLAPGGRLAIISFHSLEDRRVKQFFRGGGAERAPLVALTKRPLVPGGAEREANPRARSAKLRVAERRPDRLAEGGSAT